MTIIHPTLNLVARPGVVPPQLTFTRASGATRIGPAGLLETVAANVLRHDYDPVSGAYLGWLIEEPRTNLLLKSELLDDAAWTKGNATVQADAGTAPDGTASADKLREDTASGQHSIRQVVSGLTAAGTYTASVFIKAAERSRGRLVFADSTLVDGVALVFDLAAGTIEAAMVLGQGSVVGAGIKSFGNGWFRVHVSGKMNNSRTSGGLYVNTRGAGAADSFTGTADSGFYLWGAQLEGGTFVSSYIPTNAAAATRSVDVMTMNGAMSREGTLYAEGDVVAPGGVIVQADDGSNTNRVALYVDINGYPRLFGQPGTLNLGVAVVANDTPFRFAGAFRDGDFAAALNGGAAQTLASGTVASGMTTLRIGNRAGFDAALAGHIRHLALFPRRLSNADLQTITA